MKMFNVVVSHFSLVTIQVSLCHYSSVPSSLANVKSSKDDQKFHFCDESFVHIVLIKIHRFINTFITCTLI